MNKKFMIVAVAVLLVGAFAFVATSPIMACGNKANSTTASTDGSCASKASVQTASADGSCDNTKAMTASAKGSCDKASAMTASANSADCASACGSKTKAMNASAQGSCDKANAMTASAKSADCAAKCDSKSASASMASGSCHGKTEATMASAHECPHAKDACVNWLMANKDMTKAQAEAAYEHCAKSKSEAMSAVELATAESANDAEVVEVKAVSAGGASN